MSHESSHFMSFTQEMKIELQSVSDIPNRNATSPTDKANRSRIITSKSCWGTRFPESWEFINADASIASGSFCLSLLIPLPVGHVLSLRQQVLKQNSESICILHTRIQTNIAISGYLCRGCAQCKFDRVRFDFHRITSRIIAVVIRFQVSRSCKFS